MLAVPAAPVASTEQISVAPRFAPGASDPIAFAATDPAHPSPRIAGQRPDPSGQAPLPPLAQPAPAPPLAAGGTKDKHLFGTWLGIRPWLYDRGITPTSGLIWFPVYNLRGGTRKTVTQASQFTAGLLFDADKIAGIKGGTFQVLVTRRAGYNLSDDAGIGLLQSAQGVFGQGKIWHLSNLWYRQTFGPVAIKFGRVVVHEDFATGTCEFESTYFCGTVTGHTGAYFYNGPRSAWGANVRVADKLGYTIVGVTEDNPRNLSLTNGFYLGFAGRQGARVVAERGFTTMLHGDPKLPGIYKIGALYDTAPASDLVRDDQGGYAAITKRPLAGKDGQYGFYFVARQQLTRPRADGSHGLSMFFNFVRTDPRTTKLISTVTTAITYTGPIPSRPQDAVALAIGRSKINKRLTDLEIEQEKSNPAAAQPQRAEYAAEMDYTINVRPGLAIRPNVQWYINPAGRFRNTNAVVLGTGIFIAM